MLESAARTFVTGGFHRTSMATLAREARVSRQGLYLMFTTKEDLFREAVSTILERDLAAIGDILDDGAAPLRERVVASFDRWAGRWVEQPGRDITEVVAANPDLLDATATGAPAAFEVLLTDALSTQHADAADRTRTLVSVSVGLTHQTRRREDYLARIALAVDHVL